ncbi:MAG: substrate-binding periplasmic protein [Bdellovibrionales bacterium]
MKKKLGVLVVGMLSGLVGAWLYAAVFAPKADVKVTADRAMERVMRTGTIRCGYASAAPLVIIDPSTKALSGIGHDLIEAMGKALNLKVEWTEEIGWGTFPAALENGRIDAFCVGAWPSAARARQIAQTEPFSYQPYYAYVRVDDARFDGHAEAMNDPAVRLSVMDGDTSQIIARSDFPKAQTVSLTEMANPSEMLLNVANGKTDVAFIDPAFMGRFEKTNPGKLRRIEGIAPLRVSGNVFFIAQGEDKLRQMLNTALTEQLTSGAVEKILRRYEKVPHSILRVAVPYSP